jgi:hypothetical protein
MATLSRSGLGIPHRRQGGQVCRCLPALILQDEERLKPQPCKKIVVIRNPFSITLELYLADDNKYVHDLEING